LFFHALGLKPSPSGEKLEHLMRKWYNIVKLSRRQRVSKTRFFAACRRLGMKNN